MKKAFSLILTLSLSAGLLAGCSGSGTEKRVVNVCSWGEYIDESLIQQFEEATGIEVNYQTSPSNEELYSSLTLGGTSYDVIVPSDYMISQLIEEDMLQPLDYDKIPNFSKIADRFKNLSYDPENLYTFPTPGAPWASSTTAPWWTSPSPAGTPCLTPSMPTRS